MPRGVASPGVRQPRIWTDAYGNERKSHGRPSQEELAVRGDNPVVRVVPPPSDVPKEPINIPPMDVKEFIIQTEIAVRAMRKASKLSNHPKEAQLLKDFAKILERDMLPKYKNPHGPFVFEDISKVEEILPSDDANPEEIIP